MRDRVIHDYLGVDYDIVWDVARNRAAELLHEVDRILSKAYMRRRACLGPSGRRSRSRGLDRHPEMRTTGVRASMGPRSRERGDAVRYSAGVRPIPPLQWGRALVSAEMHCSRAS